MRVLVEICCGSVDDVLEAEKGGADRVELCSALPLGGLTPSAGTIANCRAYSSLPPVVMIRPRSGGFCYSEVEFETMLRDAETALELGAAGIVFGFLNADGSIHRERTRSMINLCSDVPTVFHRAFDVVPDPIRSIETLVELGVSRVLTSGQQKNCLAGAELIRRLVDSAMGRIEILPGGGIRAYNLAEIIRQTGCSQVHLTAHHSTLDMSTHGNPKISFGADSLPAEDRVDVVDSDKVETIMHAAHSV